MHVQTPAGQELCKLIDGSGGGTFAVAGPRGAGKTNLLRAFLGGRYRSYRESDLAVLVSAPVQYVPHDFVRYLFGETCEAVLAYIRQRDPRAAVAGERADRWWTSRLSRWFEAVDANLSKRPVLDKPAGLAGLAAAAHHNLMLINYVRTYSEEHGAKGGVKGV